MIGLRGNEPQYTGGLTDWWANPGGTRFRGARRGDVFCIKPDSARRIIGWATVVEYVRDRGSRVWDLLPREDGAYASWEERAHNTVKTNEPDPVVASVIMDNLVFLPPGEELILPADLKLSGTQEGKRYQENHAAVAYLMARVNSTWCPGTKWRCSWPAAPSGGGITAHRCLRSTKCWRRARHHALAQPARGALCGLVTHCWVPGY